MQHRTKLIALALIATVTLPACDLLKKAASGGKITSGDLVGAADKEVKANERNKKKVAELEKSIAEDLVEYEKLRTNGRFSSTGYKEKTINRNLAKLQELDAKNAMLTAAPKKIADLKATLTEELYNRKTLAVQCGKELADAKQDRMDEDWRGVNRNIVDYAKCRRKMKDVGIDESVIAEQDALAVPELDAYAGYALTQIETFRKDKKFGYAVGFEATLENDVLRYYKEISPSSGKPKTYMARMSKIQKRFRDPKEVEAEKQQAAFDAWRGQVTKSFEMEWTKLQESEAIARPVFDQGMTALESSDYKTATAKLLDARQKLYSGAYPSAVALEAAYRNGALEKGLSYEISAGLARVYFEQGEKSKLYPELAIIKNGRKMMDKEKELQIRLFDILADRKGKLSPKPTDMVKRYAGRYSDVGKELKGVKELASASRGEAFNMLGVAVETITHRNAGSSTADKVGKIVKMEEPVTMVKGKNLRFDFRSEYKVPTKCRNTKEVHSVNLYTGRVSYKQKCKYKTVKDGYSIVVPAPKGVKVKKGDIVSLYGVVKGRKGKFDVNLSEPGYVRIAPAGQTRWFLGAKTKK